MCWRPIFSSATGSGVQSLWSRRRRRFKPRRSPRDVGCRIEYGNPGNRAATKPMNPIIPIIASTVVAATPLIYAALGELIAEKARVLNLGVEGMMLVGAVAAFAVGVGTGSLFAGYLAAACAAMLMALLFAVLTLTLQTNQVATGLALTLFGLGLSAFAGRRFTGLPIEGVHAVSIPLLSNLPLLGPLLFRFDPAVYRSLVLYFALNRVLNRPRAGLQLRAVGESPAVLHALGEPWV